MSRNVSALDREHAIAISRMRGCPQPATTCGFRAYFPHKEVSKVGFDPIADCHLRPVLAACLFEVIRASARGSPFISLVFGWPVPFLCTGFARGDVPHAIAH